MDKIFFKKFRNEKEGNEIKIKQSKLKIVVVGDKKIKVIKFYEFFSIRNKCTSKRDISRY